MVFSYLYLGSRGGKIGPTRWASPVHPELGPSWAIKLLARKKSGQIWPYPIWPGPVWFDPARPVRIFFTFKRLFGPTSPVFMAGWAIKILVRKNRANFGPTLFWPSPLLARSGQSDCQLYLDLSIHCKFELIILFFFKKKKTTPQVSSSPYQF